MRKWASLLLLVLLGWLPSAARSEGLTVIVNENSLVARLSIEEISRIFLGKQTSFANGVKAEPVDQSEDREVYSQFVQQVHEKNLSAIKSYWARRIFGGESAPPRRLAGDAEVIAYVASHPGGIGYVSSAANLKGVKAIEAVGLKPAP